MRILHLRWEITRLVTFPRKPLWRSFVPIMSFWTFVVCFTFGVRKMFIVATPGKLFELFWRNHAFLFEPESDFEGLCDGCINYLRIKWLGFLLWYLLRFTPLGCECKFRRLSVVSRVDLSVLWNMYGSKSHKKQNKKTLNNVGQLRRKTYAMVNSTLQHPPWGKIALFDLPPPGAKQPFKCSTLSAQMLKCLSSRTNF